MINVNELVSMQCMKEARNVQVSISQPVSMSSLLSGIAGRYIAISCTRILVLLFCSDPQAT